MDVLSYFIVFITTMSVLGLAFLYFKNFHKKMVNENTINLLDAVAKNLAQQAMDNQKSLSDLMIRDANVQALIENNKIIFDRNEKVLKQNGVELFHIKECVVWLWTHYSNMLMLIDANATTGAIDRVAFENMRNNLIQSMMTVESYFINTFHVHPSEYVKSKQNIVGQGGASVGDFSVN